jgi:hypothetical protein
MKCHNLLVLIDLFAKTLDSGKTSRRFLKSRVIAEKVTKELSLEGFGTGGQAGEV